MWIQIHLIANHGELDGPYLEGAEGGAGEGGGREEGGGQARLAAGRRHTAATVEQVVEQGERLAAGDQDGWLRAAVDGAEVLPLPGPVREP